MNNNILKESLSVIDIVQSMAMTYIYEKPVRLEKETKSTK